MRTRQLNAIIAALESSKPTHDHYPEPVQRHQDALAAAKHLLAIADHSLMPGIAEQALADEIVAAVLADEQGEGCDLSAGMFGPQMTILIRRIVDVYLAIPPDAERYRAWRDAILAEDEGAREAMRRALPADVGPGKRAPTPAEWDVAIDALIQRNKA